jgi:DNA-3-methyladenine glycosylase I
VATALRTGADGLTRCGWVGDDELLIDYHDTEWGRPVKANDELFELLTLEGFQAGLAWITILRKREGFRTAFAGFRIAAVAGFDEDDIGRLVTDAGIVRHRGKIEAAIGNARAALALPGSLGELLWSFAPPPRARRPRSFAELPAATPESQALSKELRRRGFRFVGPTIVYAFMQAAGLVDDHLAGCYLATSARRRERSAGR